VNAANPSPPIRAIVVMGPSGTGKSTLAQALAQSLQWHFIEGDELHPPANVAKMRAGHALDEADRSPWLARVAQRLALHAEDGTCVVATCSALRRGHRDLLREHHPALLFVLPALPREWLAQRMAAREGHYMPASLLDSQLSTFEPPRPDERVLVIDGSQPVAVQVELVSQRL
jgi:gluconokinase